MVFNLQVSNPHYNKKIDLEDESITEAMETIYPLFNEKAIMVWNNIYIPLCFKYDISVMIPDIIIMLKLLQQKESGEQVVIWPSDTFEALWDIKWNGDRVNITSSWKSVVGSLENILNENHEIQIAKNSFLSEWKMLLKKIVDAITEVGYEQKNLPDLIELINLESSITGYGELYKD